MQATAHPRLVVSADGRGVVSHAGSRLLADLADRTTLTGELSDALGCLTRPRAVHDPGRVLVDLAVGVADGAECISDIAVLADQPGLFGTVASDSTVWRLLDRLGEGELAAIAGARAAAREVAWAQRAEATGAPVPASTAAGVDLPDLVIDVDASIVECHSEKEQAAATFKSGFGYHPILAFCDNSGEFLAGLLRPGNAGANTAADHIAVLSAALAQVPDAHRHGVRVLVRADGAGCCSKAFLAHVRSLRDQQVLTEFSVGWAVTDRERTAIATLPQRAWTAAVDADGRHRAGAHVAELTRLLPVGTPADYPPGTRILVRRERPHPGAQLSVFEDRQQPQHHQVLGHGQLVELVPVAQCGHHHRVRVEQSRPFSSHASPRCPAETHAMEESPWRATPTFTVGSRKESEPAGHPPDPDRPASPEQQTAASRAARRVQHRRRPPALAARTDVG